MSTQLQEIQALIVAGQTESADLRAPCRSRSEMKTAVSEFAAHAAAVGRHRLANAVAADMLHGAFQVRPLADGAVDCAPILAAMLGPEVFAARLAEHLDLVPVGMDAPQRAARVAEINAELDRLETEEEALIVKLGAPRRANARPEIVLALAPGASDSDAASVPPLPGARLVTTAQMPDAERAPRVTRSEYLAAGRKARNGS